MKKLPAQRVIVEVQGGIGNQMFQYAVARSLSLQLGADLLIEHKLGFVLDREYHGTFQLNHFPVTYKRSTLRDSFPFFIDRVKSFYDRRTTRKGVWRNSRNYLFERDFHFVDLNDVNPSHRRYRLAGYYQDPRYFESHKETIIKELTPPTPTDQRFLDLAILSREYNLIALGIRMYEESSFPEAHARGQIVKSMADYQRALSKLLEKVPNPLVLVFTSKEFDFLKSLELPGDSIFVNPDRGFTDTIDTLWLMSNCRHHIFNNSTFYWWGAVLSQNNYEPSAQKIFFSEIFSTLPLVIRTGKRFRERDVLYPRAKRFRYGGKVIGASVEWPGGR